MTEVTFRTDVRPDAAVIAALYAAAPLNRPIQDLDRIGRMFEASNVVVTAWLGDELVGILRGLTDGVFDGYVCDLAVHPSAQKLGIGRQLLARVQAMSPQIQWILRASAIAARYYEHLGWQKIENGWFVPREAWE
jgi:GNAT superfamily N-acetyltransferase